MERIGPFFLLHPAPFLRHPPPMLSVVTRVPATTANLGPGYDCLGVALGLANRVRVSRLGADNEATAPATHVGPGFAMADEAAKAFFHRSSAAPFPFSWSIEGEVPPSRGMGSSVTVRLGLLGGLNALSGSPLSPFELFELCATLEGHPDNAAPAAFGGFTVAGGAVPARFEVSPDLAFVLLIPDFEVSTPDARRVLPPQLDRLAAVASCANACRITAAFASRNYALLRNAFNDGLHQPFRRALIPFLNEVIFAGEKAGALGGFLSGSGSTICCVTLDHAEAVAEAMAAAAPVTTRTVITHADNVGMSISPPETLPS
jgi:homoserine kinase